MDQVTLLQPHYFLSHSKQHLINRLKPDVGGMVFLDNFLKVLFYQELNFL